jgi:hypothetical protein
MTVATAVAGVLVLGMSSAVMFSLQAGEAAEGSRDTGTDTANVLDQLTRDLGDALAFSERSSASAEFTVPDRDGDGKPEMLRYAWTGVAGDPLTFEYNGSSAVKLAQDVHHFDLNYLLRTVGPGNGACCLPDGSCMEDSQANCEAVAGALYHGDGTSCDVVQCPEESAELLLIAHNDESGGQIKARDISAARYSAQYFRPTLPTNVVHWKITRVSLKLARSGASDGVVEVQIRPADAAQKPTPEVLQGVLLTEDVLDPSFRWEEFDFDAVSELDPYYGVCAVVQHVAGELAATLQWNRNGANMPPNSSLLDTSDGGVSWTSPALNKNMFFYVYGTVTTMGPPEWP